MHYRRIIVQSSLLVILLAAASLAQGVPDEVHRLDGQVVELWQANRVKEAIPLAERALALRERYLGSQHPEVAQSLSILGGLYQRTGMLTKAESSNCIKITW